MKIARRRSDEEQQIEGLLDSIKEASNDQGAVTSCNLL